MTPRYKVQKGPFFTALIMTPLIWALIGAPLLLVPTVGAVIGAPFYLLIGGPVFWWHLKRHLPTLQGLMAAGFRANLASPLAYAGFLILTGGPLASLFAPAMILMFALACIHASVWGLTFGWLYRKWALIEEVDLDTEVFA